MLVAQGMNKGSLRGCSALIVLCLVALSMLSSAGPRTGRSLGGSPSAVVANAEICDPQSKDRDHSQERGGHHRRCLDCVACAFSAPLERVLAVVYFVAFPPQLAHVRTHDLAEAPKIRREGLRNSWSSRAPPIFS
jgi:hypothetical protein